MCLKVTCFSLEIAPTEANQFVSHAVKKLDTANIQAAKKNKEEREHVTTKPALKSWKLMQEHLASCQCFSCQKRAERSKFNRLRNSWRLMRYLNFNTISFTELREFEVLSDRIPTHGQLKHWVIYLFFKQLPTAFQWQCSAVLVERRPPDYLHCTEKFIWQHRLQV